MIRPTLQAARWTRPSLRAAKHKKWEAYKTKERNQQGTKEPKQTRDQGLHTESQREPSSLFTFSFTTSHSTTYRNFLPQHHHHAAAAPSSVAFNFNDQRLDFVDLSLESSSNADPDLHRRAEPSSTAMPIEKEHMFDKW
ncbi:unnamed protein product [Linum trigynum]|uniref:Uncharacterized protein n=1 Tax=Linum trigynum TaxID=586398 RepID=A0AAV2CU96_9ROSI